MTTKLTLSIDKETVKRAKKISQNRGMSISKIVEQYLNSIPEKNTPQGSSIERMRKILDTQLAKSAKLDWKKVKAIHILRKYDI